MDKQITISNIGKHSSTQFPKLLAKLSIYLPQKDKK